MTNRPTYRAALCLVLALGAATYAAPVSVAATAGAGAPDCKVIAHRAAYQGTENQPAGVRASARWGFSEVDASVTKNGRVVGIHDGKLRRLTGGDLTGFVDEYTLAQLNDPDVSHPFGRFTRTTRLIRVAARVNTPIMITLNKWGRVQDAGYAEQTLDILYTAAQAHPRPHLVFFGGSGGRTAMHLRHPDAALFRRFDSGQTKAQIVAGIKAEDIDLVGLPKKHHTRRIVRAVRTTDPTRITTRQIENRTEARTALRAGIKVLQGNRPRRIARWCR